MSYVTAADTTDVPTEGLKAVDVGGKELVLVGHAGAFYALDRRCPHMGGDLAAGRLSQGLLSCPRHGSTFDVSNGRCVEGPRILFLKLSPKDVASYPVKVEAGSILVDVG